MGHRATAKWAEKWGLPCAPLFRERRGAASPSNTMWPGPRPTSVPSGISIHPTVWPQYTTVTNIQTDRHTQRQRSDNIGRTVLQTVAQKRATCFQVMAWLSGSALVSNVDKRSYSMPVSIEIGDRLRAGKPPRFVTNHSGQLSRLRSARQKNEYRPKCGDALQLGRYGSFHLWINVWVAGKYV